MERPIESLPNLQQNRSGPNGDRAILWRLARDYVSRYRLSLAGAAVAMVLTAASTAGMGAIVRDTIDLIFVARRADMLVLIPLGITLLVIVRSVASFAEQTFSNAMAERITADLQEDMFASQVRLDLASINATHSGDVLSKFLNDSAVLRNALARGVAGMGREFLTFIGLTIVMIYMDWRLSLISVFVLPLVAWVTQALGKSIRKSVDRSMRESGHFAASLGEALSGRRVIKAYGLEDYISTTVHAQIATRLRFLLKSVRARAAAVPSTDLLGGLVVAFTIYYAGWQDIHGTLTFGEFSAFLASMLLAQQPVRALTQLWSITAEGLTAANRIFAVIDSRPEIVDRPEAEALVLPAGGAAIEFDHVRFGYRGEARGPAIEEASFRIEPGQKIALVGPSGAGKSTLFNLLLRFYDVDAGAIRIGGRDIRDVTLASLRAQIALVTQEPILFDTSVAENIALGRRGASQDDIAAAARAAAAEPFIQQMDGGYQARVGEGGLKLSGGQRQRVAIARAMLRNAPILLLDEATSALDTESERQVQDALRELMKGRTTFVIAHRLSTVLDADCIFVLDRGRIVESGTHAALLEARGLYARLYRQGLDADIAEAAQ